jgi:hypothetical protein
MRTRQRSGVGPGRKGRVGPPDCNHFKAWSKGGFGAKTGRGGAAVLAALVLVVSAGALPLNGAVCAWDSPSVEG